MNRRDLIRMSAAALPVPPRRDNCRAQRGRLLLLVANFEQPYRDLAAATLGWLCREHDVEFDVYYAAPRSDGGLFSPHGSTLLGGRHHGTVARRMAAYDTTVVQWGPVHALDTLPRLASCFMAVDSDLPALYRAVAGNYGWTLPNRAVLIQTAELPGGLRFGVAQYLYPEVAQRRALALPLELPSSGLTSSFTIGPRGSDEVLAPADTYATLSSRILERWSRQATSVSLCEPVLASHWMPYSMRENHLQVFGEPYADLVRQLAGVLAAKRQSVLYGRYGGGPLPGAHSDEDLFPLSQQAIAFEVIEPTRPVLTVGSRSPARLVQPNVAPFDLEPDDDQLRHWVDEQRKLVSLVTHSGELSHDDAVIYTLDLCGTTGVKMGLGVHWQRYAFDPECVQPMQTPVNEGGMLGLCEPVLHSSGEGIVFESLADPVALADRMKRSRDRIVAIAGPRFAPRGVYCYCDAPPAKWQEKPERLWEAIADAGFEYVISSVAQGANRVLFRRRDFVVINQCGRNQYPFSPFLRVRELTDLTDAERRIGQRPGWLMGVLDIPVHACSRYLSIGRTGDDKLLRPRLGEYFELILRGGESGRLISATPRTVARYARLLQDKGILA